MRKGKLRIVLLMAVGISAAVLFLDPPAAAADVRVTITFGTGSAWCGSGGVARTRWASYGHLGGWRHGHCRTYPLMRKAAPHGRSRVVVVRPARAHSSVIVAPRVYRPRRRRAVYWSRW